MIEVKPNANVIYKIKKWVVFTKVYMKRNRNKYWYTLKLHIQYTTYSQPRTSVHKQVTHPVATISLAP
jgi:hypothetical protein